MPKNHRRFPVRSSSSFNGVANVITNSKNTGDVLPIFSTRNIEEKFNQNGVKLQKLPIFNNILKNK